MFGAGVGLGGLVVGVAAGLAGPGLWLPASLRSAIVVTEQERLIESLVPGWGWSRLASPARLSGGSRCVEPGCVAGRRFVGGSGSLSVRLAGRRFWSVLAPLSLRLLGVGG